MGMCAMGCTAPLRMCGTACVDTSSDPNNCGRCGRMCAPDEICDPGNGCSVFTPAPTCTACPCALCTGGFPECRMTASGVICVNPG